MRSDESQSLECLHEDIHARSRRADHFRQCLLGDRRNGPDGFVVLAVPLQQQQCPGQSIRSSSIRMFRASMCALNRSDSACCSCRGHTCSFHIRIDAPRLKSWVQRWACGFDPRPGNHFAYFPDRPTRAQSQCHFRRGATCFKPLKNRTRRSDGLSSQRT